MFGTRMRAKRETKRHLATLMELLDRRVGLDSLTSLNEAFSESKVSLKTHKVAFGVDTNVVLHLANHKNRADILDFWARNDAGPLIVPGQLVQEFWKNIDALQGVSDSAIRNFGKLQDDLNKIEWIESEFQEGVQAALDAFKQDYSPILEDEFHAKLSSIVDGLKEAGRLVYAPRSEFSDIAVVRKQTKTPPGFKDKDFGDFFIWVDFLYGLLLELETGAEFDAVVLVTHDKKSDWSLGGRAHPILSSEIQVLARKPFALWGLDRLTLEIREFVG